MKLLSVCCGSILLGVMPVVLVHAAAKKMYYDYRPVGDKDTQGKDCENALENKTRYLQVEVFDYNLTPRIKATWTRVSGECEGSDFTPFSESMEYDGTVEGDIPGNRLQMDMYVCAPWGNYELEISVKSTNGVDADGKPKRMEKVAWEVEYGPDEYHIWDTLNTPFFGQEGNFVNFKANGALPADFPYAPIPRHYDDTGSEGTTYRWPFPESDSYYSLMYSGPFPPLDCPKLHKGIDYVGCYDADTLDWQFFDKGPTGDSTGTNNGKDPAEPYRMFDGIGDKGLDEPGVMTLQKCARLCENHAFIGLQSGFKCKCGDEIKGVSADKCGLEDDNDIPEYKFLCSGDSRVLCGTDNKISVYAIDGNYTPPPSPPTPPPTTAAPTTHGPTPAPTTPAPTHVPKYKLLGCSVDNEPRHNRAMSVGPIKLKNNSAEKCFNHCSDQVEGSAYFGLQNGNECFCAERVADGLDLGSGGCNTPCANTAGEICGGRNRLSVFEIFNPSPKPAPAPAPSNHVTYEPVGCYADEVDSRVMGEYVQKWKKMTTDTCFNRCNDGSNTHFGTQNSKECFCGDGSQLDKHHDPSNKPTCNLECAGDASETCGGERAMTVYRFTDEVPPTPARFDPGHSYTSMGCFADNKKGRVMKWAKDASDMTAEGCFLECNDGNHSHFGLQWAKECWCVYDPDESRINKYKDTPADCSYECAGDASKKCGGVLALSVYKIDFD